MIDRTYRVNDVVKSEFLRLPLALIANPKYKQMSLEAKFIYSLLLNRMTLLLLNDVFCIVFAFGIYSSLSLQNFGYGNNIIFFHYHTPLSSYVELGLPLNITNG